MKAARETVIVAGLLCGVAFGVAPSASCKGVSAPTGADVEAGAAVASDVCSFIDGIDDTGIVRVVCATVQEIASVVEFILTLRTVDGGPHASEADAGACKVLPGTTLCATSAERAKGILFISHVRQARLSVDGGAK